MEEFLNKKQLRQAAGGLSDTHIRRLEKAGKFPKRVQLGPGRVAWAASEVTVWQRTKMDAREAPSPSAYWILLGHHADDDTMNVLCHWHEEPPTGEVEAMIGTALEEYDQFLLVRDIRTTPAEQGSKRP